MSDITEFLLARIDEDERHARKLAETDRRPVLSLATTVNHPKRLLAECAAKRAIIEQHETYVRASPESVGIAWVGARCGQEATVGALKSLAAIYADHPDYREEWKTLTEK